MASGYFKDSDGNRIEIVDKYARKRIDNMSNTSNDSSVTRKEYFLSDLDYNTTKLYNIGSISESNIGDICEVNQLLADFGTVTGYKRIASKIQFRKGETLAFGTFSSFGNITRVIFLDVHNVIVSVPLIADVSGNTIIAEYDGYVVITGNVAENYVDYIVKIQGGNIGERHNEYICNVEENRVAKHFLNGIKNAICIGDSVTEGYLTDGDLIGVKGNLSYPSNLSKLTGWNVTNAGVSGIKASGWYATEYSKYDFSNYDIAFIELGFNSVLSGTVDSGTETDSGCICAIIDGIKSQNDTIIIVMIISQSMNNLKMNTLKKIANNYCIPCIYLHDNNFIKLESNYYHGLGSNGSMDYIHFNAIGYLAKASVIYESLIDIVKNMPPTLNKILERGE